MRSFACRPQHLTRIPGLPMSRGLPVHHSPRCVVRQESFVLLRQLAQNDEECFGWRLAVSYLPQTGTNKIR